MARTAPLDQQAIKRLDRRLTPEALRRSGSQSRVALARVVGLTRSMVSSLVLEILKGGLLDEGNLHKPGLVRPGTELEFSPQHTLALGVELGVESTQIMLYLSNKIHAEWDWVESPYTPLAKRLFKLAQQIQTRLSSPEELLGVRLAIPGVVSGRKLIYVPGTGLRNEQPAEILEALLNVLTLAENNASAATLGETFWGENQSPLVYVVTTTGLGTGLVVEGQAYRGRLGAAGKQGHWLTDQPYSRSRTKDVADTLSLRAVAEHYQVASNRKEGFWGILQRAEQQDPYALQNLACELGRFVVNLCVSFRPHGGGAERVRGLSLEMARGSPVPDHPKPGFYPRTRRNTCKTQRVRTSNSGYGRSGDGAAALFSKWWSPGVEPANLCPGWSVNHWRIAQLRRVQVCENYGSH